MQVWQKDNLCWLLCIWTLNEINEFVETRVIKWTITHDLLAFAELENILVAIKDLILREPTIVGLIYQVVPDLDYVIAVVDVPISKRVKTWVEASYKLDVFD